MKYRQLEIMDEAAKLLSKGPRSVNVNSFILLCLPWTCWEDKGGIPGLGKIVGKKKIIVSVFR